MQPILSICIPTYNGFDVLKENLMVLMPQLKSHEDSIEVIINDNASTDNSGHKLEKIINENGWNIDLKINHENIGSKNNFKDIVKRSKGNYIYLLGDDDLLSPNFIEIIFPILQLNKYSLVHFNRLSGNENWSYNRLFDRTFNALMEELSFNQFVKRVYEGPTFISSIIFKRDVWNKGDKLIQPDTYFGYDFLAHIYLGASDTLCLYYYLPLVIMRSPWKPWSQKRLIYALELCNLFSVLDKSNQGLFSLWKRHIIMSPYFDFHKLLHLIALEREMHRPHRKNFEKFCSTKKEKFALKFLYGFPNGKFTSKIYLTALRIYRLFTGKYLMLRKTNAYS